MLPGFVGKGKMLPGFVGKDATGFCGERCYWVLWGKNLGKNYNAVVLIVIIIIGLLTQDLEPGQ